MRKQLFFVIVFVSFSLQIIGMETLNSDCMMKIAFYSDLQSMGRSKQVCKNFNEHINIDDVLIHPLATVAHNGLLNNFNACTKALIHYAEQTLKVDQSFNKLNLFQCLWNYHAETRDNAVRVALKLSKEDFLSDEGKMALYSGNVAKGNIENALLTFILYKDVPMVKQLLLKNNHCREISTDAVLKDLCYLGDCELLNMFLSDEGRGINFQENADGRTALGYVLHYHNLNIAKVLIDNGADINVQISRYKGSILHGFCGSSCHGHSFCSKAFCGGRKDTILFLLDNDADINLVNLQGCTPFHYLCDNGEHEVIPLIKLFLQRGADVYIKEQNGKCPLDLLYVNGYYDAVEEYLPWAARDWYGLKRVLQNTNKIVQNCCFIQ